MMASRQPRGLATALIAPCACLFALASTDASAQSLQVRDRPSTQLSLPGHVGVALPLADGSILLGGSFDLAQRGFREGLARIDATGALDASFDPQCRDSRNLVPYTVSRCTIHALLALPDGGVLVAGAFNTIGGLNRGSLVRLRPDGQFDRDWAAVQLNPERIVELDLTPAGVVVGTQNSNQRIHYRISPVTGAIDNGFPPLARVRQHVVDIRGRSFVWRDEAESLVRLSPDGSAVDSTWLSGLPEGFAITELVYHRGIDRLFATAYRFLPDGFGGFSSEHRVLRFDPQAATGYEADWSIDFDNSEFGAGGDLRAIAGLFAGADHRLILSPAFGNDPARGIIAVDAASGQVLTGLQPAGGTSDQFRALANDGTAGLLVASLNPDAAGSLSPGGSAVARLRANLSLDAEFTPRVRNIGSARGASVAANGEVVVHGEFSRVDDHRIASIFRLRPDLTVDQQWIPFALAAGPGLPTPSNSFWSHAADGVGRVYLSRSSPRGLFPPPYEQVDFQRLDRNGGQLDPGWSWIATGTVVATAFDPTGRLYIGQAGGLFGCSFNAGLAARLRVDAPCAADPDWRPSLSGFSVSRLIPDNGGFIYALGLFQGLATDGSSFDNVARLSTADGAQIDVTWRPQPTDATGKPASIRDIALDGDVVYAGGDFTRIAGQPWRGIARLSTANGALDTSWNSGDQLIADALALDRDGLLYSIDRTQPFGPRTRVVVRDTEGQGLPLAAIALQGAQPDARDVITLPDGGAIVVGRFALANGHVRTGLMAVGPQPLELFYDSFEQAAATRP